MGTDGHRFKLKNYAFKFEAGIFEIQKQSNPQFDNAQVI